MLKLNILQKAGLYCGDLRWGSQVVSFDGGGAVLKYNSFICLVDGYDSMNPTVYFVSDIRKRTFRKLNKLLSKDKREYYDFLYKDFYSKKPKITWLQFNPKDSKAIYNSIKTGEFAVVNDLFNQEDMSGNGFDYAMNSGKLKVM